MWLTPISPNILVQVAQALDLGPIYLVRPPESPSEYQLQIPTLRSRPMSTVRLLTRSPGVWVPPIELRTPESEHQFGCTPSELQELWSEIMDTLARSPKSK